MFNLKYNIKSYIFYEFRTFPNFSLPQLYTITVSSDPEAGEETLAGHLELCGNVTSWPLTQGGLAQ
jgi:hypothetical protein